MRTLLLLFICGAAFPAQDVAPTFDRALGRLSATLVRELPWLAPEAGAVTVSAADRASEKAAGALRERLLDSGFRLAPEAGSPLVVTIAVRREQGVRTLAAEVAGPKTASFKEAFGDADWIDRRENRERVVVGPPRKTADAARQAAEERLTEVRRASYPALAGRRNGRRALDRAPAAVFVAASGRGAEAVYEAFVLAPDDAVQLARLDAEAARALSRAPVIKGVVTAVVLLAAFAAFKFLDWITRGWRTRALSVVFATLTAAAVTGLWRLPV